MRNKTDKKFEKAMGELMGALASMAVKPGDVLSKDEVEQRNKACEEEAAQNEKEILGKLKETGEAPIAHVIIHQPGKEPFEVDLESMILVGVKKDGIGENGAKMTNATIGVFDEKHVKALANGLNRAYDHIPQLGLTMMLGGLFDR